MQNIFNLEQIYSKMRENSPSIINVIPMVFYIHMKQDPSKTNSTNFNKTTIGNNDLIQTYSSSLYTNVDNQLNVDGYIGSESSNVTVYNYNVHNTNNLYESFVQSVYRLPDGSIGISHTPKLQHFNDYYALPSNNTLHIAPVVFGTGMYIDKRGIAGIISSPSSSVKALILFLYNNPIEPIIPFPV
jgi:hypothetical protein